MSFWGAEARGVKDEAESSRLLCTKNVDPCRQRKRNPGRTSLSAKALREQMSDSVASGTCSCFGVLGMFEAWSVGAWFRRLHGVLAASESRSGGQQGTKRTLNRNGPTSCHLSRSMRGDPHTPCRTGGTGPAEYSCCHNEGTRWGRTLVHAHSACLLSRMPATS